MLPFRNSLLLTFIKYCKSFVQICNGNTASVCIILVWRTDCTGNKQLLATAFDKGSFCVKSTKFQKLPRLKFLIVLT